MESSDQHIAEMRERAEHYRRLAAGPMPWRLVGQLEGLADECDDEARKLASARRRRAN